MPRFLTASALFLVIGSLAACGGPNEIEHVVESDTGEVVSTTSLAFAPDAIETVRGTIATVTPLQKLESTHTGVRITLATASGNIYAYLGPVRFMDVRGIRLFRNDRVMVRGSLMDEGGQAVMIANEISKDGLAIRLRDDDGAPLWKLRLRKS